MIIIKYYEKFYVHKIYLMIELPNLKPYEATVIKTLILVKEQTNRSMN